MNRRSFIKGLGTFLILPGAGRIWKVTRPEIAPLPGIFQQLSDIEAHPMPDANLDIIEYIEAIHRAITARVGIPDEMEIIITPESAKNIREFFGLTNEAGQSKLTPS